MATTRFDTDPKGEARIGILGHDFFQALTHFLANNKLRYRDGRSYICGTSSDINEHLIAILVFSSICGDHCCFGNGASRESTVSL